MADRPAEVVSRTVPSHEGSDLLKGACNGSTVGTLVKRVTRPGILARMDGTETSGAHEATPPCTRPLRTMLIYDRGKEMADHARLLSALPFRCSFRIRAASASGEPLRTPLACCASTCQWARGDSQRELNASAHRLCTCPRKYLYFATLLEVLTQRSPVALGPCNRSS